MVQKNQTRKSRSTSAGERDSASTNTSNGRAKKRAKPPSDGDEHPRSHSGRTPLGVRFLEAKPSLGSSRQRLLRQILDESNETFFLSSREMGRRYDVNTATIIRTIQALGYEKFADFAHDLREYFVTGITPYSAMKTAEETEKSVADRVRRRGGTCIACFRPKSR